MYDSLKRSEIYKTFGAKDIIKKVRRQITEWKKIFTNQNLIKVSIQNIERTLTIKQKINHLTYKWAKEFNISPNKGY